MKSTDDHDVLSIDLNRLEKEWQAQPRAMMDACREEADARRELADRKTALKIWESETALRIRKRPDLYGLDEGKKPTEGAVEATLYSQPEYKRLCGEIAEATHLLEMCEAKVTSLHQKKAGLENAVVLWSRGYFAECKLKPEDDPIAREKMRERTQHSPIRPMSREEMDE